MAYGIAVLVVCPSFCIEELKVQTGGCGRYRSPFIGGEQRLKVSIGFDAFLIMAGIQLASHQAVPKRFGAIVDINSPAKDLLDIVPITGD